MTLKMRRLTLVNFLMHVIDKEVEGNDNQTIEETMNTN